MVDKVQDVNTWDGGIVPGAWGLGKNTEWFADSLSNIVDDSKSPNLSFDRLNDSIKDMIDCVFWVISTHLEHAISSDKFGMDIHRLVETQLRHFFDVITFEDVKYFKSIENDLVWMIGQAFDDNYSQLSDVQYWESVLTHYTNEDFHNQLKIEVEQQFIASISEFYDRWEDSLMQRHTDRVQEISDGLWLDQVDWRH